ncbi:MAG: amidohydrolase family protein [Planctomycetota bacterium]|jgi:guanine deaminase
MLTLYGTLLQPRSPADCDITPKSIVRIADDGTIAEVGSGKAPAGDTIGDDGCWILPGFIDAHLHLPQWDRRGIDGLSLFDWLDQIVYPAELRFKNPEVAEQLTEECVTGLIANGTTTIAAFGSPFKKATDRSFAVFARRRFRVIHGMMLNDVCCPDELSKTADRALDESRELASKWHGANDGLLQYAFCPRMATCCSEELMRGTAALAGMIKCHIQTHVGESPAEESAVRERFPDYFDDVDVFAATGLLTSRTLLGHAVCLSEPQRHRVAETHTTVVHCPTANLFLESGLMDYVAHRNAQIPLALGSSIAAGHDPFMPQVAVACLQTAKTLKVHNVPRGSYPAPSPAEAWWLLTKGAANALRIGERVGAVAPGFHADCLVVRPEGWIADLPPEQQISALLYTIKPHQIEHTFIAGRRVGP